MKTFATDANNDLFLDSSGSLSMASDQSGMAYVVRQKLMCLTNELRFNLGGGIIYRETVFSTGVSGLASLRAQMISELNSIEGVLQVQYLDIGLSGETVVFQTSIATEFGVISLSSGG